MEEAFDVLPNFLFPESWKCDQKKKELKAAVVLYFIF